MALTDSFNIWLRNEFYLKTVNPKATWRDYPVKGTPEWDACENHVNKWWENPVDIEGNIINKGDRIVHAVNYAGFIRLRFAEVLGWDSTKGLQILAEGADRKTRLGDPTKVLVVN